MSLFPFPKRSPALDTSRRRGPPTPLLLGAAYQKTIVRGYEKFVEPKPMNSRTYQLNESAFDQVIRLAADKIGGGEAGGDCGGRRRGQDEVEETDRQSQSSLTLYMLHMDTGGHHMELVTSDDNRPCLFYNGQHATTDSSSRGSSTNRSRGSSRSSRSSSVDMDSVVSSSSSSSSLYDRGAHSRTSSIDSSPSICYPASIHKVR